ncbi:hypothetical protein LINGRAHAP2_LOCUS36957 [Linum grandiflorum]
MAKKNEPNQLLKNGDGGKDCRQFQPSSPPTGPVTGGRKVESYFDAHPWFDSDGEEYHSVNGDFGSSRSFSPIIIDNLTASKIEEEAQMVQPSIISDIHTWNPVNAHKKQLSEFFSESFNRELETEFESKQQQSSASYVENYSPSTSTDRTSSPPNDHAVLSDHEMATRKKKSVAKRACIPSLMRSLSCGGGTTKPRPRSMAAKGKK